MEPLTGAGGGGGWIGDCALTATGVDALVPSSPCATSENTLPALTPSCKRCPRLGLPRKVSGSKLTFDVYSAASAAILNAPPSSAVAVPTTRLTPLETSGLLSISMKTVTGSNFSKPEPQIVAVPSR